MQQNVRVTVQNRGCCSAIVGGFLLLVVITVVAGAVRGVFRFATSVPGVILIAALAIAAALYFSRRRAA